MTTRDTHLFGDGESKPIERSPEVDINEPAPVVLVNGVSYRVTLRVTPGVNRDGSPLPAAAMWSADVDVTGEGSGYVEHGATAAEALKKIGILIAALSGQPASNKP